MGQKINPQSLRLAKNKNWDSNWFSKKDYANNILEDFTIRKDVVAKFPPATIESIKINRERGGDVRVLIYTPKPGILIGKSGKGIEELKNYLEKRINRKIKIEIFEINNPETSAQIVAENIAYQLAKRVSWRRAINMAIQKAKDARARGIKITVSGRLGGVEIARRENFISGSVPTQTLKSEIDFAKVDSFTKFGTIGIKVWIYKG